MNKIHILFNVLFLYLLTAVNAYAEPEIDLIKTLQEAPHCITTKPIWHPEGKQLAAGCILHRLFSVWDIKTGKIIRTLGEQSSGGIDGNAIAYSPDGKYLAVGRIATMFTPFVEIYNAYTGEIVHKLMHSKAAIESSKKKRSQVNAIAFSADGRYLAVGGHKKSILELYDVATGVLARSIDIKSRTISAISFSEDGKWLAVGHYNVDLVLVNAETWKLSHRKNFGRAETISVIAFSPDGDNLAFGSYIEGSRGSWDKEGNKIPDAIKGDVVLLDINTLKIIKTFQSSQKSSVVEALQFTQNGKLLIVGAASRVFSVHNIASGKEIVFLKKEGLMGLFSKFTVRGKPVHPSLNNQQDKIAVSSGKEIKIYKFKQ